MKRKYIFILLLILSFSFLFAQVDSLGIYFSDIILIDKTPKYYLAFTNPVKQNINNYEFVDYTSSGEVLYPSALDSIAPNTIILSGSLVEGHEVAIKYTNVESDIDTINNQSISGETPSQMIYIPFNKERSESIYQVIQNFDENVGLFWDPNGSGSTRGILNKSSFVSQDSILFHGAGAAKLSIYDDPSIEGGWFVRDYAQLKYTVNAMCTLMMLVRGSATTVDLCLVVKDTGYEMGPWKSITLSEDDWQVVSFDLLNDEATGWLTGDGIIQGDTVLVEGFRVKCLEDIDVEIYIDELISYKIDTPPVWEPLPDTSIIEDSLIILDIDKYLYDELDDNSTLNVNIKNNGNLRYYFNNHILTLYPEKDVSGYSQDLIVEAIDPWGYSSSDTFNIYIVPINDPPVILNETKNVYEETPFEFTLDANDVDNESSELEITLLDSTINGELSGTLPYLTYLSDIDYNGFDSLKFTVNDGQFSDTGRYIFNVLAVNDRPIAFSYDTTTFEDQEIQLLFNGKDIDGTFSFTVLNNPAHGSLSGSIPNQTYTPNQNYYGSDQIGFLMTDNAGGKDTGYIDISIQSINDPPEATFSDAIIYEGEIKSITLTASPGAPNENDQALTYILRALPEIGSLSETEGGTEILQNDLPLSLSDPNIFYASHEKFTETSFIYNVQDNGGSEYGGLDTSTYQRVKLSMNVATKLSLTSSGTIEGGVTILGDNTLYAPSSGDKVYRFDTTGTVMYSLNVNGNIKSSSTITSNHNVYIASTDYNLYSFNANGLSNPGWPKALGSEATASVAIDNSGNCYIGTENGIFQCIASDGTINWGFNVGAAVYASAAISAENILYVVNGNGRVYAFNLNDLDPSSISPKWTYETGEAVSSSPALDLDSSLYITTESGSIIKLADNGSTASKSWSIDTGQKYVGSPVISSNGYLYIGGEEKIMNAVNINNGAIIWQDTLDGKIKSTVSLNEQGTDEDRVYVGDDAGKLYAINKTTGEIIWQYQADDAINCPILYADNHVYFGTTGGDIISIEDKFEAIALEKQTDILTSIWPTFQGNNQRTGAQVLVIPAISIVYPGDTNNDGSVDVLDVLPIGVYFLEEGSTRASASNIWEGQNVTSWPSYPANYADCNGDGVVDEKDIIGVGINWGSTRTNSINKFMINPNDKQMLAKHKEAFETIYNSVDGLESAPAKAIRQLLETTLEIVPESITLYQCYPNPFNPSTEIRFSLPEAMSVSLKVYDINGRLMTILIDNTMLETGYHNITFNGESYSSGMYIYVLETENSINAQKMMLIK